MVCLEVGRVRLVRNFGQGSGFPRWTIRFQDWERSASVRDALRGAHVHDVEDTTVDESCANTGRQLAADTQKREQSHLRTQIIC